MPITRLFYPIVGVYIFLSDLLAPILLILFMDKALPSEICAIISFFLNISHVRWFAFAFASNLWIGLGVVFCLAWLSYGLIMNYGKARSYFIFLSSIHLAFGIYFLFIYNIEAVAVFDRSWWLNMVSMGVAALFLVSSINISCDEDVAEPSSAKSLFWLCALFVSFIILAVVFIASTAITNSSSHKYYTHKKLSIKEG